MGVGLGADRQAAADSLGADRQAAADRRPHRRLDLHRRTGHSGRWEVPATSWASSPVPHREPAELSWARCSFRAGPSGPQSCTSICSPARCFVAQDTASSLTCWCSVRALDLQCQQTATLRSPDGLYWTGGPDTVVSPALGELFPRVPVNAPSLSLGRPLRHPLPTVSTSRPSRCDPRLSRSDCRCCSTVFTQAISLSLRYPGCDPIVEESV